MRPHELILFLLLLVRHAVYGMFTSAAYQLPVLNILCSYINNIFAHTDYIMNDFDGLTTTSFQFLRFL